MSTDADLVAGWRGGDTDAGEALIERHYDAIVRFFRTKTDVGVEDLVQRTFLVCAERLHSYGGVATFRAFLFGIARNVLFEHLRAKLRDGRPAALNVLRALKAGVPPQAPLSASARTDDSKSAPGRVAPEA